MKLVILAILLAILASLGSGLYHLFAGSERSSEKLVTALTWRIALSVSLFCLLFIGWFFGLIEPGDLG